MPGGRSLVDCASALGAVALGYAHPGVTHAVVAAARAGNVSILSHRLEVEVAERLCAVVPCAERVRFLKSGAEACAAKCARSDCGCIAACYAGADRCRELAGARDGCAVRSCDALCR